ncbi:MAG: methyltransferase domain-containing protein [Candidatus Magnetobacterium sp. LHC-1]|uniref:Class I SAM-dependent methyltransferase n=1 Tax=Candidatus Magnetobacterium casense TaxID=1455061 RepID=A0ABS6RUL3_9BACT|nr:methyltransferase domain-containing protein [Candidatus Magnetobacterium casensis]MBV6340321.1 class I SAM-dependent methyltransferase [Candidatus Magnetobacterium casensis]
MYSLNHIVNRNRQSLLDDPQTTSLHAEIIKKNYYLKALYVDFYSILSDAIDGIYENKLIVELGSGGGFIKDIIPNVVTSDVIASPTIDMQISILDMPFKEQEVDVFFMLNVLHHINDANALFDELNRCLKVGGRVVMIEPSNTLLSSLIWRFFHHEPFMPEGGWTFEQGGRLSAANIALPWIIFYRDIEKFEKNFPSLRLIKRQCHTPLRYLLSGGLTVSPFMPPFTYKFVLKIERLLSNLNNYLGMFMTIVLEKVSP